ncbi:hypothetical protein BST13_09995 [Mycobacterium aquaticum]|uniref:Uncharacterized protein n=2 Tax=Mycobacterium aquaticum TaxID=1927124 RepID=A0A1X0B3Z9_9MYCO|nr:hypothetical protein BST13_09995 [Mycobacterium aquaticum]
MLVAATVAGLALLPITAATSGSMPRALAQDECSSSDVQDSYSLSCVPTMVPDTSDQLTEDEIAQPGYNGHSDGGGGGGGHR